MKNTWVCLLLALVCLLPGCTKSPVLPGTTADVPEVLKPLVNAEKVILFSIDGTDYAPGTEPQTPEKYHAFPVLGKLELSRESTLEIAGELAKNLNDKDRAKCFWPRHGIRAIRDDIIVDYLICFQCNVSVVIADGRRTTIQITSGAQPALDKILAAADIPLARAK